jgi:pimeloyl-ACP methyl ester carboxylesterase
MCFSLSAYRSLILVAFVIHSTQAQAQSVVVSPQRGSVQTKFIVSSDFTPCPCGGFVLHDASFYVDNNRLVGPSGLSVRYTPFSLDTLQSLAPGTHILRGTYISECGDPDCLKEYDVQDTFTVYSEAPVTLVHGICGSSSGWDAFEPILADSGFDVSRFAYGPGVSSLRPAHYVRGLAAHIKSLESDDVAVVAHSMGGLITREYMRRERESGREPKVSQLVTLGTPHHGSDALKRILSLQGSVDAVCPSCDIFNKIAAKFGNCLGHIGSRAALVDMLPGSVFLNRLNYGTNTGLYDGPSTPGWSAHAPEALDPDAYHAAIAGTATLCDFAELFWGKSADYQPNDGVVAVGSALLANDDAFASTDIVLPVDSIVAHTNEDPMACRTAIYRSEQIAAKVARILRTSPSQPPPGRPELRLTALTSTLASPEDSLSTMAAIRDSVPAGQVKQHQVMVPATTLLRMMLFSDDAHLSLLDPGGSPITVNDTSTANGISFFAAPGGGLEGFDIQSPLAGTWTFQVDATASQQQQDYACLFGYATGLTPEVSTASRVYGPNDPVLVRAWVADGAVLRTDVTWTASVVGPDNGASALVLADDGAHNDSLPGDGIYGGAATVGSGDGLYRVLAAAGVPGAGSFFAATDFEARSLQDLLVQPSDIYLSKNVPEEWDSLTVFAMVHNVGVVDADSVVVEFRDLVTGLPLGADTLNVPAGGTTVAEVPWVATVPDSHAIEAWVSPHVLDEITFSNNAAVRPVVLGTPVAVDPVGRMNTQIALRPPRPNPTNGKVILEFSVPRPVAARLVVVDVLGRVVREWRWPLLGAGSHLLEWDGRNSQGTRVRTGMYFFRLAVGRERVVRRLVVLE